MPIRDVIATALAGPLDWGRFEELVYAVLVADDLPRLRKIGGGNDQGIDDQVESFYNGQRQIPTIVQVSAERAERGKVRETIAKLRRNGIECRHLIFVTRLPVESEFRREMIAEAEQDGVTLEVREEQYLIANLSKPGSPIFARFYGTVTEQLATLLHRRDPLEVADTPLKHALLASLGAYVLSPRARLARGTLFQNTVLAAMVVAGGRTKVSALVDPVTRLVPGEAVDQARLSAAVDDLLGRGACAREGDEVVCTAEILEQFVFVTRATENGYRALVDHIFAACRSLRRLDDATFGYIERNVRRALLVLLRGAGPLKDPTDLARAQVLTEPDVASTISRDLSDDVAHTALVAFADFVQAPEQVRLIAPLVRAYSALAIRNMDPIGRRWQQVVLSRSTLALDTDAVLAILVEDLPEHRPLLTAIRSLQAQHVQVVIADHVLDETVLHVSHADRTFRRFADTLLRLPEAVVDGQVWHAVVRGFYYAARNGYKGSSEAYWHRYYDEGRPAEFVKYILAQRLRLQHGEMTEIPADWEDDCRELEAAVMELKERARLKAEFRDDMGMARRVHADVRMILHLAATRDNTVGAQQRGYLISEDRAFVFIEWQGAWRDRGSILVYTRAVPQLAAFVCGSDFTDDDLVRLLFDPAIAAAAAHMAEDLATLAAVGVDLHDKPLTRLEWDLAHQLKDHVRDLRDAGSSPLPDAPIMAGRAALAAARAAGQAGYSVAESVAKLAESYDEMARRAEVADEQRQQMEERFQALATAIRDVVSTKKGRRRVNRVLREMNIELDVPEEAEPEA